MSQQPNQHDQKKEEMNQPTTPQTWREKLRLGLDEVFEDAHSYTGPNIDETFDRVFEFTTELIQQTIEQEVKKERAKIIKEIENTLFEGQASEGSLGFGEIINKIESVKE